MPTYTLAAAVEADIDIRKSRFIAHAVPVADREAAMAVVEDLRAQHPGATHVCWALMAGGHSGMSDDGEPSGTAGRPILEVLRHHELEGVLGAVVRYYGGIKLGAGGLVRAYTDAIATALKQAERVQQIAHTELALEVDYADEDRVRRWIIQENLVLATCEHGVVVSLLVRLPTDAVPAACESLRDLTQGRAHILDQTE